MERLTQLGFLALFLIYLTPAQAMLKFEAGIDACPVFADDDGKKDGGKKDGGKKGGGKGEEEEPDCE